MTVSDHLPGYCRIVPCRITDDAKQTADRFFDNWHCFFGLPERIVNDRDMCFTNKFWRSLHKRLGVKLQMLTAFHPQTDGRSEKTNKTAVQVLRNLVLRTQKDWVCHLLQTEFAINAATSRPVFLLSKWSLVFFRRSTLAGRLWVKEPTLEPQRGQDQCVCLDY